MTNASQPRSSSSSTRASDSGSPASRDRLAVLVRRPRPTTARRRCGRRAARRARARARRPRAAPRGAAGRPRARTSSRLLELGLDARTSPNGRVVARDLVPQRGQRRLAGRVDEQRRDVVEELVADRALDRPVAQRLAGVEDLLHPDVLARRRRAAAAGSRPGRRARRDGRSRSPSTVPSRTSASASRWVSSNTCLVLLAHGGEVVDVEEAPVAAGLLVEVEEARAAAPGRTSSGWRRRSPCGSGRCRGSAPARPRAPRAASASNSRSPPSSSEIASGRRRRSRASEPGARLERRRQVEVADAEVAQVGHELARLREAEAAAELQPVGGAERRHVSRAAQQHERATARHGDVPRRRSPGPRRGSASGSSVRSSTAQRRAEALGRQRELDVLVAAR